MIPAETILEMSKSATPGPWHTLEPFHKQKWIDQSLKWQAVVAEDNETICTPLGRNAGLIASAPELAQTALELHAKVEELQDLIIKAEEKLEQSLEEIVNDAAL